MAVARLSFLGMCDSMLQSSFQTFSVHEAFSRTKAVNLPVCVPQDGIQGRSRARAPLAPQKAYEDHWEERFIQVEQWRPLPVSGKNYTQCVT